ncbi:MAG: hypothetical protein EBX41_09780, partial [Chitinophagia bacterium]|nr:hypothetical protein [Chitinophagia bacterium]
LAQLIPAIHKRLRNASLKPENFSQHINPFAHSTKIVQLISKIQIETMDFYDGEGDIERYKSGIMDVIELCVLALITEDEKAYQAKLIAEELEDKAAEEALKAETSLPPTA